MVQGERQKNKRYRPGSRRQNWKNFDYLSFQAHHIKTHYIDNHNSSYSQPPMIAKKETTTKTNPNIPIILCQIFTIFAKKEAATTTHPQPPSGGDGSTIASSVSSWGQVIIIWLGDDHLDFNSFDILILPSKPINIPRWLNGHLNPFFYHCSQLLGRHVLLLLFIFILFAIC